MSNSTGRGTTFRKEVLSVIRSEHEGDEDDEPSGTL